MLSLEQAKLEVRLLVDGQDKGSTNLILNGVASLTYSVPSNANNLQMDLEITPLVGQGIAYEVDSIANFTMDSIAPMLIGMNVKLLITEKDHLLQS